MGHSYFDPVRPSGVVASLTEARALVDGVAWEVTHAEGVDWTGRAAEAYARELGDLAAEARRLALLVIAAEESARRWDALTQDIDEGRAAAVRAAVVGGW
ncbi:hypothetical protein GCM10025865_09670 [Paraoerskovia sediminicola]|uniref:Uncharacterized protein n=1 Tax=Paraoerskovia sediminicola TaxID=1138587 RepID=A0ABM8G0V2_9CELL|nr:hypothetical protein [Paraoerskovia sediminicola]BDZ41668.1 hypothetical protein GCM10025865_09670 [Paraoerskovia sediminicola]